jgi:hypothetical protein
MRAPDVTCAHIACTSLHTTPARPPHRSTYIVKQVSVRNRVCVLIDWFKSKTFGRAFTSPAEYFKDDE